MISKFGAQRPASQKNVARNLNPNTSQYEDKQTGIIVRKIDFDEKMMKYILGVMQLKMEVYLKEKDKVEVKKESFFVRLKHLFC